MTDPRTETHNRLARDFVSKVAGATATPEELMVVIETTILAGMTMLMHRDHLKPATAAEMVETAVHAATERFTANLRRST